MSIDDPTRLTIEDCARRSHAGDLDFASVVATLAAVGVESYHVDYRVGDSTYYLPSGAAHAVALDLVGPPIAAEFAADAVQDAVRGAQRGEVKYPEFVRRTRAAGCVGYCVWISGRHVVYFGRRGETHVERFPDAPASSPRGNALLVQRIYDAFRRRDPAAALALCAPDLRIEQSTEVPWGGRFVGHDGALRFFAGLGRALSSAVTFERFVDAGDHVVAIGRTRGTLTGNGQTFDVPIAHVWQLQDGRAVHARFLIDNPTMLAALA